MTVLQHTDDQYTVFGPQAFARSIGKTVPLTIEGRQVTTATLTKVEYSEDQRTATLTLEIPDSEDQ